MRALLARLPDGDDLPTALLLIAAPAVFTPAVLRVAKGEARSRRIPPCRTPPTSCG
jgi:citrate synthase